MIRELAAAAALSIAAAAWGFIAESPGALEGGNIPDGPFLAVASHNCQPIPGADFTRALSFIVAPQTAAGKGFISETACQFHASDALPALAPGRYEVAGSQCTPDLAAVVTRWQTTLQPYAGGGDGGCDQAGPLSPSTTTTLAGAAPPLLAARAARPARQPAKTFRGTCIVRKGGMHCTLKGDVPTDVGAWH